jgi:hypothetical protein
MHLGSFIPNILFRAERAKAEAVQKLDLFNNLEQAV